MRSQFKVALVLAASLLLVGLASAQPQLPTFQRGQVLTADELNRIVGQVNTNTEALSGGVARPVDCSSGTIAAVMSDAQPGDTIRITGTCNETVVVDKDGITLDGGESAVIDGAAADAAVILVKGHRNVTIKGLTVRNGLIGIHADGGAAVGLENVTARNNNRGADGRDGDGIRITASVASFAASIRSTNNDGDGIDVFHASSVRATVGSHSVEVNGNGGLGIDLDLGSSFGMRGTITVTDNTHGGLLIRRTSAAFFLGDSATFSDNGGSGVHVGGGSSATLAVQSAEFNSNGGSGVSVSEGSTATFYGAAIEFNNNGGSGVSVFEGSTATLSGAAINGNQGYAGLWVTRGSTVIADNLTVENNALRGIGVFRNSHLELYGSVLSGNGHYGVGTATAGATAVLEKVTSKDNASHGISAHSHSHVDLRSSTITDNGSHGIFAPHNAHIDIEDSTITGNATDIEAGVLSRIGWENSTVGTMICDDSVLTYYDALCAE